MFLLSIFLSAVLSHPLIASNDQERFCHIKLSCLWCCYLFVSINSDIIMAGSKLTGWVYGVASLSNHALGNRCRTHVKVVVLENDQ
ncbi:hypothetical protein P8452_64986 [Trifolium repens]|nr:hypothetical protein P8452_64986 [Trifolium repens]